MKKNTLFKDKEMGTIQQETLRLYEPSKDTIKFYKKIFSHYTVPELKKWANNIMPLLKNKKIEVLSADERPLPHSEIEYILAKRSAQNKADLEVFLTYFMADKRNMEHYIRSLSEKDVLLYKQVIKNLYCSQEEFANLSEDNKWIKSAESRYYFYNEYHSNQDWFHTIWASSDKISRYGHRETTTYYYLPSYLRPTFASLFFPETQEYIIPHHQLLPEENLMTFNGELTYLQYYPILQALYEQGTLCMGKTKMLATTLKKVSAHLYMKEFFEEDKNNPISQLRASTMLPTIALLFDHDKKYKKKTAEDLLKDLHILLNLRYASCVSFLLPHITGIKSSVIGNSTIQSLMLSTFTTVLASNYGWISAEEIVNQILIYAKGINPLQIFDSYTMDKLNLANNDTGELVCLSNLTKHLGIPFLKGLLYLMAGFGLVEVAYRQRNTDDASIFDTLKYVRMTDLGRYVFHFSPTYTPPQNTDTEELFCLDEQRLVIRSLKEDNPYEALLNDTAIAIGNHRYMMNNESFLKNCRSEKDVKDKIDFFKRFISKDIPEVWKNFFESLIRQCHPLKAVSADSYVIYQLDGNNKELIQLLSTDPLLKSIIIRAEGYKILVEKKQQKAFMDKLKAHGYLL
jgi:hypothetical protein